MRHTDEALSLISDISENVASIKSEVSELQSQITEINAQKNRPTTKSSVQEGSSTPVRMLSKGMPISSGTYSAYGSALKPSFGKSIVGIVTGKWDDDLERKWTTSTAGAYLLAPEIANEAIELVRPRSVVTQAGAVLLPVTSSGGKIPRVTNVSNATWKAQLDSVSDSTITIDSVDWSPKTLISTVRMSRELFDDTSLAAQLVEQSLLKQMAFQLDYAALMGSGTGQEPQGIFGTANVNVELGANAPLSRTMISNAVKKVLDKNFVPNALILNPRDYTTLDQLVDETTDQPLNPFPSYNTLQKFVTAAIPINLGNSASPITNTTSRAFVGDFSQVCFVIREGLTVEASTVSGDAFAKHAVDIKCYGRFDIAVLNPGAFTVIRDLTA